MAFWNRRKAESRALPPPENQLPYLWHGGIGIGNVNPTNATAVADAYACIRLLSESAGSLPLIAYRRIPGGRERVESGKLADLLQRPAPGVTQSALITQLVAHLNLWGNAFLGKYRRGGDIVQLGPLQPDRVQVEVKNGEPRYKYMPPTGPSQMLTTRDVLHVKAMTTDGLVGLSPVAQAKTVLGLSDTLARHAASTFGNNATPRGILRVDDFTSDDAANEALRQAWEERHQGPENAGLLAVTSGQVEGAVAGMSEPWLTKREPGPVAISKGISSLVAGLNARDRDRRWRVSSPPDRLEGAGAMGSGQVDGAGVVGPDDESAVADLSAAGAASDEDAPHHPREKVA